MHKFLTSEVPASFPAGFLIPDSSGYRVHAPCREYRSGPLLTDRFHILPLARRRGYHVPSKGTVNSGRPWPTPRVLRRAARSRAREEHPEASISLWEPGFLPNFSFSYLLCGKLRLIR